MSEVTLSSTVLAMSTVQSVGAVVFVLALIALVISALAYWAAVHLSPRARSVVLVSAIPRTSRGKSTEPAPPATVEKRTNTGVFIFGSERNPALVTCFMDLYG